MLVSYFYLSMPDTQPAQQNATQPETTTKNTSSEKIHLTVRNRVRVLFEQDVQSVTSTNDTGIFDILPEHANFISLITSPLIIRKLDGQKYEIPFTKGLLRVKDNAVFCYVDLMLNK